jgi:peptide/nickel transport system permease protein
MLQEIEAERTVFAPPTRARSFLGALEEATRPWRRRPLGIVGAAIIAFLFFIAVAAPLVAPHKGDAFVGKQLESPSTRHLFGTNNLGQDVLSRTIYGAQISVAVGFSTTLLGVGVGTILGIVSAYFGGFVDQSINRSLEVLASFPGIMLALIVMAALGRPAESGTNMFVIGWQLRSLEIAIAMGFMFGVMRVVRSAVLTQRALAYVEAASTIGAGDFRIMFRHIFPNVFPVVIVAFSSIIGGVILIEAGLSFLGFGVSVGTPSWGIDLSNRNREYFIEAPWLLAAPGLALSLAVLGFNFLGDTLRDILDPRMRGTG